ncbi:MAG: segregation/condensation protein A [Blastochloris sp.]|nr:segregation/condensation protein A [Blastochloris sp.]
MLNPELPGWRVSLPVFDGPLDLLLYLIKKEEMNIYDIEVGKITSQYLQHLDAMREMDLEVAGDFLVVAATLLYIKSRTLLPVDQQMAEEEPEEGEDPRWELIRQLVEYKKFKDASFELQLREGRQEKLYYRETEPERVREVPAGLGEVGVFDLVKAFQRILQRAREKEGFREIYEEKYTVSDKIQYILDRIELEEKILFTALFNDVSSRPEIVVTFLALLELVRLKQLKARQSDAFGEIEIYRGPTPTLA